MNRKSLLILLLALILASCSLAACDNESDDDDDTIDDDDTVDDDDDDDDSIDDDDDDDDTVDDDDDDDDDQEGPYYQDFLRYWHTLDEGYSYFIVKDIDWNLVFDTYNPAAFAETDAVDFKLMIAEITASLRDSHTWSTLAGVPESDLPYRPPTGVCLQRIGGKAYVSRLSAEAQAEGMQLGDEVTAIDGQSVDDLLDLAQTWEGCSSPHCCDFYRLPHVDRFSAGENGVVYSVLRDASPLQFDIERTGQGYSTCKSQPLLDFLDDASGTVLRYKPIGPDLGYVHLSTLNSGYEETILQDLDQALADFAGRDGIVFDARYNHGGSDLVAMNVLQRFLDHMVIPVSFRYKSGPGHDEFTPWLPEPVLGGSDPTDVRVVFLINGGCISAADFFVAAASYVPTFTLLGTSSCGATGAPNNDTLPASGITYYYSQMQRKYRATGEQIEGIGIAPDIVLDQHPDDLASGIDTQLEAAIDLLRE